MISIHGSNFQNRILSNMSINNNAYAQAMQRLSTGIKINNASDDAAGLTLSTKIQTQASGLYRAQQNAQDAISMLRVGEDSLSEMTDVLQKMREVALQAVNDTNTDAERFRLQKYSEELVKQLYEIKNTTTFNDTKVLGESFSTWDAGIDSPSVKTAKAMGLVDPPAQEDEMTVGWGGFGGGFMMFAMMSWSPPTGPDEVYGDGANTSDFVAGQEKHIEIDGISYSVKNNKSTSQQISFDKNSGTGELTFYADECTIKAEDVETHNLIIQGTKNYIYGGDNDDNIRVVGGLSTGNYLYGGMGNDTIITEANSNYLRGEEGNDILRTTASSYSNFDGGDGNDTIYSRSGAYATGGNGNDTFVGVGSGSGNRFYGNNGDDSFIMEAGNNNAFLDGGADTNTLVSNGGTGSTIVNMVAGNTASMVTLAGGASTTQTIDGKDYTFTNTTGSSRDVIWEMNGSQIDFKKAEYIKIEGQDGVSHNVRVRVRAEFYGGDQADTIYVSDYDSKVYGGDGNDVITNTGQRHYIYGEGGNDTIIESGEYSKMISGGVGDDNITVNRNYSQKVQGDEGNDTFVINGHNAVVDGGDGNDAFTVNSGMTNAVILGGAGTNTLVDNSNISTYSSNTNQADEVTELYFSARNEVQNVTIDGKDYAIKNLYDGANTVGYSLNTVTHEILFAGYQIEVAGDASVAHKVKLVAGSSTSSSSYTSKFTGGNLDDEISEYGHYNEINGGVGDDTLNSYGRYSTVKGGDGDDTLSAQSGAHGVKLYGGDGDDILNINANSSSYGEAGSDVYNINYNGTTVSDSEGSNIYNINSDGNAVVGGSGADTFNINGDNNIARGAGGHDYYIVEGDNNEVEGGSGDNYVINNGSGTTLVSAVVDPNAGVLSFTAADEVQTFTVGGNSYTVTNQNDAGTAPATNSLSYSINPNTGEVTLEGDNLTVVAADGQAHNLVIKGDNNTINGGNSNDKIRVEQGTNNIVNGNAGHDNIIMNSDLNYLRGGSGNDTIVVNGFNGGRDILGEAGDDNITVNGDNHTNIVGGDGNDRLNIVGDSNTVDAGDGNDSFTVTGDTNTLTSATGSNTFSISGNENNITGGANDDNIGVSGHENVISDTSGDNTFTALGNENDITSGAGDDSFFISGNLNTIVAADGDDDISAKGNDNQISSTSGTNTFDVEGSTNTITGGTDDDTVMIEGNSNVINTGDSDDFVSIKKDSDGNTVDGGNGLDFMIDRGLNTTSSNILDITPDPTILNVSTDGSGSQESEVVFEASMDMDLFMVDITTAESARETIEDIDAMLESFSLKRAEYGATINKFESIIDSQANKIQNLKITNSYIKDADMAVESANMIRSMLLQDVSANLLASFQGSQDSLLQIIQGSILKD